MEFGGRQFANRGTTANPIYDLSGETSGSSGGLGTPAYICNAYTTEITTTGSYKRTVTYYNSFKRLDSGVPQVDLSTMLHYTTSNDQNAELSLMPVVSQNPTSHSTSVPPEFIGNSSVIAETQSNILYQYTGTVRWSFTGGSGGEYWTAPFTRDTAVNYFIVNDAGKFYFRRVGFQIHHLTLYKVDDNWNPGL